MQLARQVMPGELAAFGAFFAVESDVPVPDDGWLGIDVLVERPDLRVEAVAQALGGGVERRVAVSVAHLGVVARLVAPALATVALGGRPMAWRTTDLRWRNTLGGPFPLRVAGGRGRYALAGSAVEAITLAFTRRYSISPAVLWGNVGSAANSAARLIATSTPELTDAAGRAADVLLADLRVDGGTQRSGPGFRRRSCCLTYRLSGSRADVCGDCVLPRAR